MQTWLRSAILELERLINTAQGEARETNDNLRSVLTAKRQESVRQRLERTTVEALKGTNANLKLAAVGAGGISNAAQVLRYGILGLQGLPNVGEHTARSLVNAANGIAATRRDDLRPRTDARTWDQFDRGLVNALRVLHVVGPLLGVPNLQVVMALLDELRQIAKLTAAVRWFFADRKAKARLQQRFVSAARNRQASAFQHSEAGLRHGISESRRLRQSGAASNDLAHEWSQNNATWLARLEQIVAESGTEGDKAASRHGLSGETLKPELVRRIEAHPLDLSLCSRTLRGYQAFGAKFALAVRRCLLGDDMGLGKTIQALAVIGHAISGERQTHHLVVCPASLVDNWLRECHATLPTVSAMAYRAVERTVSFDRWVASGGILIASFEQATQNLLAESLPTIGVLIVDEAHYAKNPEAKRSQSVGALLQRCDRAVLMSGTMLENRAAELIQLVGMADWRAAAELRRTFGNEGEGAFYRHDEFTRAIGGVYLRRNQSTVLDELPDVVMTDEIIEVGQVERSAYRNEIAQGSLMGARRALSVGDGRKSAKIGRVGDIAEECRASGQKLLVFSYFTDVVKAVAAEIGDSCEIIDGAVPAAERQMRLDRLRDADGFRALAMQIDVGSVGHNIQAASVIILVEPQFKPSTEAQAIARAHRMGQTSTVVVYRLIASDSVDERLVALSNFKAELFDRLARNSALADLAPAANDPSIDENSLLQFERTRLRLAA